MQDWGFSFWSYRNLLSFESVHKVVAPPKECPITTTRERSIRFCRRQGGVKLLHCPGINPSLTHSLTLSLSLSPLSLSPPPPLSLSLSEKLTHELSIANTISVEHCNTPFILNLSSFFPFLFKISVYAFFRSSSILLISIIFFKHLLSKNLNKIHLYTSDKCKYAQCAYQRTSFGHSAHCKWDLRRPLGLSTFT